jgi:hypothetical protein
MTSGSGPEAPPRPGCPAIIEYHMPINIAEFANATLKDRREFLEAEDISPSRRLYSPKIVNLKSQITDNR